MMISNLKLDDSYYVYNDYEISNYTKELYLLYLPLVEQDSIKLYQYFGAKIIDNTNLSKVSMHYDFTDNLAMTVQQFILARKKLEAIGLLESYVFQKDNKVNYFYKVKKPLSFKEFFNTPILNILLKNKIGDFQYNEIHSRYRGDKIEFNKISKNITAKFSDVYSAKDDYVIENNNVQGGPNIDEYYFDFAKLAYLLSSSYLEVNTEDEAIKQKILGLAYLYQATPEQMAKGIEHSVGVNNGASVIDINKLADYLIQIFTHTKKNEDPILDKMVNKALINELNESNKEYTEEQLFAKKVDSTNYIDYLLKKKNIKVSTVDAKNIQKLQEKYNFPQGVLNILLDYATEYSDGVGVPNYNYMDKIASGWSSLRLADAKDAIDYVRRTQASRNAKSQSSVKQTNNYNKNVRVADVPDYISKQIEDFRNRTDMQKVSPSENDIKELEKFKEMLNKKKKGDN